MTKHMYHSKQAFQGHIIEEGKKKLGEEFHALNLSIILDNHPKTISRKRAVGKMCESDVYNNITYTMRVYLGGRQLHH